MTLVPSRRLARTLVDELARAGVRHACIAPGSRSAPIALALAERSDISVHVHLDERSASFMALGIAVASGTPVVVTCTSGTAAANFLPAIREADLMGIPLIVLTADRPPELRDTGANQTLDQIKMYGDSVRWFCEVGVAEGQPDEATADAYWRSVANRSSAEATGSPPGPVHLNVALREPLVEGPDAAVAAPTDPSSEPARTRVTPAVRTPTAETLDRLATTVDGSARGLVVAGAGCTNPDAVVALAEHLGWPLLAEPLSNARRGPNAITAYDGLLRHEAWAETHRPDLVVRFGKIGISKALATTCAMTTEILVEPHGRWWDPSRSLSELVVADPAAVVDGLVTRITARTDGDWLTAWQSAGERAGEAIDRLLDTGDRITEPSVARDLVAHAPDGTDLVVGASMPFRDVEFFARPREGVTFYGNRGANGIDGFVSTALGVALASGRPTIALCGDLTMLHDANGLLGSEQRGANVTFVVVNNDGGGIFSFLPQARLPEHFEQLFGTPQDRDFQRLAAFHRIGHELVTDASGLARAVSTFDGVRIVEVRTDRDDNVALHEKLVEAVATALTPGS